MRIPLGEDLLEVDFDWTSYGSSASWYDPGDAPEVQILSIEWEVGITIPECVWDVMVPAHGFYSWEKTMSLSMYCETWIIATEDPNDYIGDDYDY